MDTELVSIVIPNHNREKLLVRAVESIIHQTYKNIEIIIVDDCSTDNSSEIIIELEKKYKNIKGILLTENRGANYCRNLGVEFSKGNIISFLDSDDTLKPNKIQIQFNTLKDNIDKGIEFVTCSLENKYGKKKNRTEDRIVKLIDVMFINPLGGFSTLLMTKRSFLEVGGLDETMPSCQDWDLYLKLLTRYNGYYISDQLVDYYIQEDSISKNHEKVVNGHKLIFKKINIVNEKAQIIEKTKLQYNQFKMLGAIYRSFGQNKESRKYFRKNLKNEKSIKSLFNFLSTYLNYNVYKTYINLRNKYV
ncbi:glycosyltransferase family 2 protein [Aerococcus urinaeequi]|uniref:glycosyltransferase family 2 protein n=1 Tax=Aerococcus urinaeequi TaxID=51665 RepID=UPI003D6B2095